MKKVLFIGGTGTISTACVDLAVKKGLDVTVLNRGRNNDALPDGVKTITADINDEAQAKEALKGKEFDAVADFVAFTKPQVERDVRLFTQKTAQYIVISSASAYQKPLSSSIITESTPLHNPYWQYSRDKIAIEERLMKEYRDNAFPVTIVRPSHTYGDKGIPVQLHGDKGSYQVIKRIVEGKPILVAGDGLNWWTLTHNTDFAKAFVGLMGNPHAIGEAYHITSDESLTWNQIHNILGYALGKKVESVHISTQMLCKFRPDWEGGLTGDKCASVHFDNTKVKTAVPEFVATTRYDQGVYQTLDYIMSHPVLQQADPEFDKLCDQIIDAARNFKISE